MRLHDRLKEYRALHTASRCFFRLRQRVESESPRKESSDDANERMETGSNRLCQTQQASLSPIESRDGRMNEAACQCRLVKRTATRGELSSETKGPLPPYSFVSSSCSLGRFGVRSTGLRRRSVGIGSRGGE
eukprot:GHVU01038428.1.p1 GENE.GHVU01038428.1~~GHVU01038428.1.p1  ORF type:complete len:132 (+),score=7.83 GHVU01038428.1:707-1102(+)